jgi:hypothetical protein
MSLTMGDREAIFRAVRQAGSTAPAKLEPLFEPADTMFGRNK